MNADQVLRREVQVVFADLDPGVLQFRGKENDESIARVLLDLRTLVLVADVLERQLVKLEGLLEQRKVRVVRVFDVEPESLFAITQAFAEPIGSLLEHRTLC